MICCLNPNCNHPENRDTVKNCRSCGMPLEQLLRGRYKPVKLIGRGGFGRTYLALDSDRLNAPCVIKQFAPQTQGTESFNKAVELFNQEAVRLHELGEHSQIPTLLAYFEHDHYLYLVQQFIDGKTLIHELAEEGPLDEVAIHRLLQDILPVLDFIHRHNVIHRDITPTNLIRRESDRRLFLIDFGIAKQLGAALSPEPGTRIGTEGYSPIEQLRSGQAYPCSDLYSLGATCLHLLTGQKPEQLYDPIEGCWRWREALARRDLFVGEELGHILDRWVLDAIGDRFQTAQEVLKALKYLPVLQGNVPGWVRQHPTGRLSSHSIALQSLPIQQTTSSRVPLSSPHSSRPPTSLVPAIPPPAPSTAPTSLSIPQTSAPIPPTSSSSAPATSTSSIKGNWHCVWILAGHQSWVTTVDFNPRMATLISGSLDDLIYVWNLQTGKLVTTLDGHPRGVNDVAVSAKGQVLVSCGDDSTVKVWNLATGRRLHTLRGHVRDVTSVAMGHKSWILASGSKDKSINLWKPDKGTLIRTLVGSPAAIKTLAMTPDEAHLLSGGLDNKLRLWDLGTGEMVRTFSGHLNPVNGVAVSQDGQFVASASKDKTVRLWSVATGKMIYCLKGHTQAVNSVAIAPDNRTVISGSTDRTIRIWDARTGNQMRTLTGHASGITDVAVHRTGRLIASASADKTVRVWKLTSNPSRITGN